MPQTELQHATRRDELPLAGRSMEVRSFARAEPGADASAPLATARLVLAAGAAVRRYDWFRERCYDEVLVVEPGTVRMDRLQRGAPLLNTHSAWDLESVLGKLSNPEIIDGRLECDATFSRRESVAGYVQDVADEIIVNVSVGYARRRIEMVAPAEEGGVWTYRVVDWEAFEGSLVPIPADMDAQVVRSAAEPAQSPDAEAIARRTFPCEFIELSTRSQPTVGISAATTPKETAMPGETQGGNPTPATSSTVDTRSAPAQAAAPDLKAAEQAAITRSAEIIELCQRHGLPQLAADYIRAGKSTADVGLALLDELAKRDAGTGGHRNATGVRTVTDEVQTRMAGMEEAVMHRVHAGSKLSDNARQFRGMTLLELARDFLQTRGIDTRGMDRLTLAGEALRFRSGLGMMGTSDFSSIMASVANKRLRMGYEENPGTYTRWARRAPNAPDFKNISVVQLSATPDLLRVNEHGEFKYGSMTDGGETYALLTYGRVVSLTRQAIVNDDLRAFDRLVAGFGASAMRLENRTVYAQLTSNPTMADTGALFNATAVTTAGGHANLGTGGGSVLQVSSLVTARTAMRLQKGLQGEELNLAPSFLLVPAALEQTAYQLTSSSYVPATVAAINEFRSGGRTALDPIVEPILDANSSTAWYLAAANSQVDTVEFCYLDGAEGPVIESEMGFDIDGMSLKCRLDFAAKAIDFRGLYRSAGA
jgi:hypothetical protein